MNTFIALNEARKETQKLVDAIAIKYSVDKHGMPEHSELVMSDMSVEDKALYMSLYEVLSKIKNTTRWLTDGVNNHTDLNLNKEYQDYCR